MDPVNLTLLIILASIIAYIIYQGWKINQHWKNREFPHVKPWLFFGNAGPLLLLKLSPGELHQKLCKQFPNLEIFGFYDFMKPTIMVQDLDYIEKIVIKDFAHFVDRGFPMDDERNPLESNLVGMTGKRWKAVRNKLSPIFTSGKLKMMFDSMEECGNEMIRQMDKMENQDVEMKEVIGCFAMDAIGSCVFGIDSGSLSEPDNEFRRMGKNILQMDTLTFIKFLILINFPTAVKLLNLTFGRKDVVRYFARIVKETLKYRRESGFKRNDFVQMILQLQEKGYVEIQTKDESDDYLNIEPTYHTDKFELSEDQLTGHAVGFLTAGFDGITASTLYALYELSKHTEIQEKAREEVLREVQKAGKLTYDAIREMNYLEQCIQETLRKYPPAQMLLRVCVKDYTFPNGFTVKTGENIIIPVYKFHYDPKYFPEPEKFIPERFDPDNNIPNYAHMPFGLGPRICIAMRFTLVEMKYCLAKLLMNYSFKVSPKTEEPLTLHLRSLVTIPKQTVYFNFKKINSS